ncbi:hypothetical protein BU23DRAFT_264633 [Bimuria novae-zelandiae CBS 107.79]|uniref:Uncharacterized protein n=1 Tax=Bimuria novae-zelandiae CBS 107.79 TaxID=1447943 RepID=A0A6A5UWI7_9PLEO|nr:hypothetical protein BU23DRAFT_264633 [Bimuria novae-zelandiae CBS 107.79]
MERVRCGALNLGLSLKAVKIGVRYHITLCCNRKEATIAPSSARLELISTTTISTEPPSIIWRRWNSGRRCFRESDRQYGHWWSGWVEERSHKCPQKRRNVAGLGERVPQNLVEYFSYMQRSCRRECRHDDRNVRSTQRKWLAKFMQMVKTRCPPQLAPHFTLTQIYDNLLKRRPGGDHRKVVPLSPQSKASAREALFQVLNRVKVCYVTLLPMRIRSFISGCSNTFERKTKVEVGHVFHGMRKAKHMHSSVPLHLPVP